MSESDPSFHQRRLQYLLLLRLLAIGAQLIALALMAWGFDIRLPWLPVGFIITGLLVYTAITWYRTRQSDAIRDGAIFRQLLVDVTALSGLVYFTGGSVNPFITLFLLPITFAAASLPSRYTWTVACTAIAAYTLLMFFNEPFLQSHTHASSFSLHLWGMWYGFIISAALLVYFVGRLGRALQQRDRSLATAREEALRAEQLIAMGTLATGTAHELGTPLSTMAVLVSDLQQDAPQQAELDESLSCLREQIDRCKAVLARLASDAGELQAEAGQRQPVSVYLDTVLQEWRQLRAGIEVQTDWRGPRPGPAIIADRTITQALLNVFNNAADAGAERIDLSCHWDEDSLHLTVIDDGSGLTADAKSHMGNLPYSDKPAGEGMGLGLFLARLTLQRFGGSLEIDDHAAGGTRVGIFLPLRPILAGSDA